ncbi:MAG: hypothetical protein C4617_02875 [Candidatus Liberibacter europaeus]|uniref:DUF4231 domain-containing protein n=1 Tax=Candidatus Liberibacter europaeus TaxID=744859 RepID=A0A2T4VYC5_9HYPH|nr:hypothetical protein [Candidatus Liberibacter europaeus]PTL86764.1 MAG: hypothetical protein C4617_02875 [Candidatus Liberibacter europaeus]
MNDAVRFPKLYDKYDKNAVNQQRKFLWSLKSEVGFLICVHFLSFLVFPLISKYKWLPFIVNIFLLTFNLLISCKKYWQGIAEEKYWYKSRAYAESIKSVVWKFYMRTKRYRFKGDITSALKKSMSVIVPVKVEEIDDSDISDIVKKAEQYQKLDWKDRKKLYLEQRVLNQLNWYKKKSKLNADNNLYFRRLILIFASGALLSMMASGILILYKFEYQSYLLNVANMFVTSSMIFIGWSQIKRYNELSETYDLTAKEIENLIEEGNLIVDECSFGHWVEDSETAFSREHTMWGARRNVV